MYNLVSVSLGSLQAPVLAPVTSVSASSGDRKPKKGGEKLGLSLVPAHAPRGHVVEYNMIIGFLRDFDNKWMSSLRNELFDRKTSTKQNVPSSLKKARQTDMCLPLNTFSEN